ncbi:MAG: nucleoside 2-deoxyribosyltransferase [Candidatus Curtissbacteria bacterium]|nr:nucleoside 2-deoxyribosyltransferase [Candidatus Curtissbacteria bacterium]
MNIYFAGSITGGRDFEKYQHKIVYILKSFGHKVLSEHVSNFELQKKFRAKATKSGKFFKYISGHDKKLIYKADAIVAECSQGSLGTGFEICYGAYVLKIPVICLRFEKAPGIASSTIFGDDSKLIRAFLYNDKNLEEILQKALKSSIKGGRR